MQVSIETTSGLERRLTVGVPAERVETEVATRLKKAAKTVRLDGFRQGKVPMKVVKQRFGAGVRQEVVGEIINSTYFEAVTQEKVNPAGQPEIEPTTNESGSDLQYTATFEVYPDVELADLSTLSVVKEVAEIEAADVDNMIDVLRKQQAKWIEVERAAEEGDQVNIDYLGTKDGEEFAGGKAEGSNLELGSGQMIPGFEDGVVGMKAGEEKVLALSFPEDYHAEELKGAAVEFTIKLNKVSEQELPELNDEFFAQFGVAEGGEEKFRSEVSGNMERELKNALVNKLKGRIIVQLLETHQFDVPKSLMTTEIGALKRQMMSQFGGNAGFDESMLPDELFLDQADRRVRSGLVFSEIVKANDIKPEPEKVREKIEEIASTYEDADEVINYYYGNQELLSSIESVVAEDKIVEFLEGTVNVTEEKVSYTDGVKPDPEVTSADD